jgi:hypothetical protein
MGKISLFEVAFVGAPAPDTEPEDLSSGGIFSFHSLDWGRLPELTLLLRAINKKPTCQIDFRRWAKMLH